MPRSICGAFHWNGSLTDAPAEVVSVMLDVLPGRGREGRSDLASVSFGYREIWEDAPKQGYCSAGRLSAVVDARLDNRPEIFDALDLKGQDRFQITDCELILKAYERWGENCPKYLYGDYAFAVWDANRQLLFCTRDAVGIRPLYYSKKLAPMFVFSSDINAVLAIPNVRDDLDEAFTTAYLMGEVPDSDRTFFLSVCSLPPGHSITIDTCSERVRRWWNPETVFVIHGGSDENCQQEFLDHYRRSVRDRLEGPGEIGVHVSGGVDSSSIASLAARELRSSGRRPYAFCWQPPPRDSMAEDEVAEYQLIESVCTQEGLEPRYHPLSLEHILAHMSLDVTRVSDYDGTMIHEELVQLSASELDVRVILSGWGGDEVASCSGAEYYTGLLCSGHFRQLLREAQVRRPKSPLRFIAKHAVLPLIPRNVERALYSLICGELPRGRKPSFVHPALARKHRKTRQGRAVNVRQRQLMMLQQGHLEQRIQSWSARGARMGIEYRYPLLDRRLIEYFLGLPPQQFRFGNRRRWFFLQAMQPVLPPHIISHYTKTDPARHRPLFEMNSEVIPLISQQLSARQELPIRAGYLDMTRLQAYLENQAELPEKQRQPGKIMRALKFLDWSEG